MVHQIIYTEPAVDDLERLPRTIAQRIAKKVKWFAEQAKPLQFAKALQNTDFGQYRFRVGDYRVIFDVDVNGTITILLVLRVKHRREVYRDL